jgi:glycosyltransferase involved in cell wall biosynthesis
VGGNPELVSEDRGILVSAGEETSLADAILRLAQNESLRIQMGQNCRRFAVENFSLDQMRRRHEALYTELLARKGNVV